MLVFLSITAAVVAVGLFLLATAKLLTRIIHGGSISEGRFMTGPGRHRQSLPPGIPDQFAELEALENVEPWVLTHHLYGTHEFKSAEDALRWMTDAGRKGRVDSWNIQPPRAASWSGELKDEVTLTQLGDYVLDSMLLKTKVRL